ncbi:hypothetical protein XA68_13329 [Ophiocordyceps unilateralis]|uniref:HPP transmembrane region domain-containing protein n=1 Tax=Ophiocordyceps unilateralis TaxID=268505 RepID=A0A2A9PCU5_OPHUN|nr:hypothetical protein XA68_13329 [Ophiocordyceps unilateralis]
MLRHRTWNWDIDRLLNPLLPPPPWARLPYGLSRFLGYRRTKPPPTGNLMPTFWAFIGILVSLLLIAAVTPRVPLFRAHGVPVIVGSFGAAAVLEFCTIESPLAQPRNAIVGQMVGAVAAIIMAKLFQLSDRFDQVRWVGGALACASATALMNLTGTVHPPAGATALLAVVDPRLVALGWLLLPVVMLGCALMLAVALLVNNIERRFPLYWWTAHDLSRTSSEERNHGDCVSGSGSSGVDDDEETTIGSPPAITHPDAVLPGSQSEIVVRHGRIFLPKHTLSSMSSRAHRGHQVGLAESHGGQNHVALSGIDPDLQRNLPAVASFSRPLPWPHTGGRAMLLQSLTPAPRRHFECAFAQRQHWGLISLPQRHNSSGMSQEKTVNKPMQLLSFDSHPGIALPYLEAVSTGIKDLNSQRLPPSARHHMADNFFDNRLRRNAPATCQSSLAFEACIPPQKGWHGGSRWLMGDMRLPWLRPCLACTREAGNAISRSCDKSWRKVEKPSPGDQRNFDKACGGMAIFSSQFVRINEGDDSASCVGLRCVPIRCVRVTLKSRGARSEPETNRLVNHLRRDACLETSHIPAAGLKQFSYARIEGTALVINSNILGTLLMGSSQPVDETTGTKPKPFSTATHAF